MRKRRVLLMVREDLIPPRSLDGLDDKQVYAIRTEYDVQHELLDFGHELEVVGIDDDLTPLREAVHTFKPHVVFNLLEEFARSERHMAYLLGYLELVRQPYTGCNPVGMMLSADKGLQRKILRNHRVRIPEFHVFRMGRRIRRPKKLTFPLIVKSATVHGSVGISQASIVTSDEKLQERIEFVHQSIGTDALVEQYIAGRELYVGVLGNQRLQTFPPQELNFEKLPEGTHLIATEKAKWDVTYQKRIGLNSAQAKDLDEPTRRRIDSMCKRAYKALSQSGYARLDLRLADDGKVYLIESNPNCDLAHDDEFAEGAKAAGMDYSTLIQRILSRGERRAWS